MVIDSKFRYMYTLELSPHEFRLLCDGMSELEAHTSMENLDYNAITNMEKQLGENVSNHKKALSKIPGIGPVEHVK